MTPLYKNSRGKPVELSLPFPPSNNRLWRAVNGGNILSEAYRLWRTKAAQSLLTQPKVGIVRGPYVIGLTFERPDRRGRDIFNYEKAVSDYLVSAGIVEDDKFAERGTVQWSDRPAGKGAQVHVQITPWGEA